MRATRKSKGPLRIAALSRICATIAGLCSTVSPRTGPRDIAVLWHFHPDCAVALEGVQALTGNAAPGNLRIVPAAPFGWQAELVTGREAPDIQGWYSVGYNRKCPAAAAVYAAHIEGPATFAWLLLPAEGAVPQAELRIAQDAEERAVLEVEARRAGYA